MKPAIPGAVPQLDRPVVVYDGACGFCLNQVDRIKKRDRAETFEYVPRQAEGLEQRFPALAQGDFNSGMRLVLTDGSIAVGPDAVYEIARRVQGWNKLAWLYRLPVLREIFRALYAWVARHRKRLARQCDSGACVTDAVAPGAPSSHR